VVKLLLSKHEALTSIPVPPKQNKNKNKKPQMNKQTNKTFLFANNRKGK
jgi:hypothetical protein